MRKMRGKSKETGGVGGLTKNRIDVAWSPNFAYALGLLATDGNLSPDGRHFDLTSNDREQLENFMKCLGLRVKIGRKKSGSSGASSPRIQFGSVKLYEFLLGIGFMPRKSKIIAGLDIPDKYFFDFLCGHFDGDGTFYSYWDKRWRSSFMFYTEFISASKKHVLWIQGELKKRLGILGHITKSKNSSVYQLKYAKAESLILLPKLYYDTAVVCLARKRKKVEKALEVAAEDAQVAKLVHALP